MNYNCADNVQEQANTSYDQNHHRMFNSLQVHKSFDGLEEYGKGECEKEYSIEKCTWIPEISVPLLDVCNQVLNLAN